MAPPPEVGVLSRIVKVVPPVEVSASVVPERAIASPPSPNVTGPFAVKVCPLAIVKLFLTEVVPEPFAPMVSVVAAPAKLTVVAVVLNRFAVDFAAIRSDVVVPSIVIPALAVTAPVNVEIPSTVNVPSAWIFPSVERVTPSDAPYPLPSLTRLQQQ